MGMYEYLVAPVDRAQVQRISDWVYDVLDLDAEILVTIRQNGSSYAVETVITYLKPA